jgi:hypothetical protein
VGGSRPATADGLRSGGRQVGLEEHIAFAVEHLDPGHLLGFLQTPPRGDALALLLAFGSAITWHGDSHPARSVPCLAHTLRFIGGAQRRPLHAVVGPSDLRPNGFGFYDVDRALSRRIQLNRNKTPTKRRGPAIGRIQSGWCRRMAAKYA